MSFTLLSAALLLCVGACVIPKVMRGYRQGLARSAISLSAVVFSALAAIPLAVWLSDYPADLAAKYLPRLIPALTNFISLAVDEWFRPRVVDALSLTITFVGMVAIAVVLSPRYVERFFRLNQVGRLLTKGQAISENSGNFEEAGEIRQGEIL